MALLVQEEAREIRATLSTGDDHQESTVYPSPPFLPVGELRYPTALVDVLVHMLVLPNPAECIEGLLCSKLVLRQIIALKKEIYIFKTSKTQGLPSYLQSANH